MLINDVVQRTIQKQARIPPPFNRLFNRSCDQWGVPSYFDRFGPVPTFSGHAWRRLHERALSWEELRHALATEPKPGTSAETLIYSHGHVTAVVNAAAGRIVTVWWTA